MRYTSKINFIRADFHLDGGQKCCEDGFLRVFPNTKKSGSKLIISDKPAKKKGEVKFYIERGLYARRVPFFKYKGGDIQILSEVEELINDKFGPNETLYAHVVNK